MKRKDAAAAAAGRVATSKLLAADKPKAFAAQREPQVRDPALSRTREQRSEQRSVLHERADGDALSELCVEVRIVSALVTPQNRMPGRRVAQGAAIGHFRLPFRTFPARHKVFFFRPARRTRARGGPGAPQLLAGGPQRVHPASEARSSL